MESTRCTQAELLLVMDDKSDEEATALLSVPKGAGALDRQACKRRTTLLSAGISFPCPTQARHCDLFARVPETRVYC